MWDDSKWWNQSSTSLPKSILVQSNSISKFKYTFC